MTAVGLRRERVTFQQRGVDENGDRLGDWEAGFRLSARVVALERGETVMQARLQGVQPIRVTMLSKAVTRAVTTAWRIVWGGAPYNIRSVAPGEARDEIVFLAEGDQSDG